MPLITSELSVWDIAFRWANFDPDKFYLRYPLAVKDNFRLLMEAILKGEIHCNTMILAKLPPDSKANPKYYIRTHLDDVNNCIWGTWYKKKMLKWALISRNDFHEWCERRGIPYPEFWFPDGWKYNFEWPEYGTRAFWAQHVEPSEAGMFSVRFNIPEEILSKNSSEIPTDSTENNNGQKLRTNQVDKKQVQIMAVKIWAENPEQVINISQMARHEIIQKYSEAPRYDIGTIIKWVREVAPYERKGKSGRPPQNSDKDTD